MRIQALQEIWGSGFFDFMRLIKISDEPAIVGRALAEGAFEGLEPKRFIRECLAHEDVETQVNISEVFRGFLSNFSEENRLEVLTHFSPIQSGPELMIRLLLNPPADKHTWTVVEQCGNELSTSYWQQVKPYVNLWDADQLNVLVDKLLAANRPMSAFQVIHFQCEKIETSLLKSILQRIPTSKGETSNGYNFSGYDISAVLKILQEREGVTEEEMAALEFLYIEVLEDSEHGIKNLHKQLVKSPLLFVQFLAIIYKRKDDCSDPEEWGLPDMQSRYSSFRNVYVSLSIF